MTAQVQEIPTLPNPLDLGQQRWPGYPQEDIKSAEHSLLAAFSGLRTRTPAHPQPTQQERVSVSVFADEDELIERAQAGDGDAFANLLRSNDRAMRACAYQLLGNQSNMDDALQEAYIKAFQSLPSFRQESKFSSWLYRIVYRTCLDQQRYRSRRPQEPLEYDGRISPAAERGRHEADSSEQLGLREELQDALAQLPEDQAAVVILVDAEGFTYDEVAATMDLARGTIASRLSRARATLRTILIASDPTAAHAPLDTPTPPDPNSAQYPDGEIR